MLVVISTTSSEVMNDEENILYQADSRITLLESTMKIHDKEIEEIKRNHKEFSCILFRKIDEMKSEMHAMTLSSQAMSINNQRWMIGLMAGFITQTAVGIFLLIINKGGL
tara:strand:+ start:514 stop:843 length:330 start_codon:yes stop_codon:yes gene_type:complete